MRQGQASRRDPLPMLSRTSAQAWSRKEGRCHPGCPPATRGLSSFRWLFRDPSHHWVTWRCWGEGGSLRPGAEAHPLPPARSVGKCHSLVPQTTIAGEGPSPPSGATPRQDPDPSAKVEPTVPPVSPQGVRGKGLGRHFRQCSPSVV